MKLRVRIAVAVSVVAVGLVGYRLISLYGTVQTQMKLAEQFTRGPTVAVSIAQKRTVQWNFEPVGTVESRENVDISAKSAGRISAIYVRRGDKVKKGQVLVKIDADQARANLLKKRGDLANARFTYYQQLAQQEMTSVTATTGISKAQADLSAAAAGVDKSQHVYRATLTQGRAQIAQSQARLVGSQAQLRQALVDFEKAKVHYERMLELQRQGFSSAADSQDSYQDVLSKKAAVDRQRADVKSAQADVLNSNEQARKESSSAFAEIQTSRFNSVSKQASVAEARAGLAKNAAYQQQLQAQRALVASAQAELRSAELSLEEFNLRSPVDGYVSDRKLDVGALANAGSSILSVQSGGKPWVGTSLPQECYGEISIGQACRVAIDGVGTGDFAAHVISKDSAVDTASGQFNIRVQLEDAKLQAKPGMFARIRIDVGEVKDALTVPNEALHDKNDSSHTARVYQVVDHKIHVVPVVYNLGDSTYTTILKGLQGGEAIVVEAAGELKEGDTVRDQPAKPKPSPSASGK